MALNKCQQNFEVSTWLFQSSTHSIVGLSCTVTAGIFCVSAGAEGRHRVGLSRWGLFKVAKHGNRVY